MLIGLAAGIHHPKIVLGMLVKVFGRDSVSARSGLASQTYISFENLIRITANFNVRTVAVEGLITMRQPRPIMMRIIPIIAPARSLVWTWSHDTNLIWVDTVGS